jgi:hypothetical protein
MLNTKIKTKCAFCRTCKDITVPTKQYKAWKAGKHIQLAMPKLSDDDRELIISGICPKCWNEKFADD